MYDPSWSMTDDDIARLDDAREMREEAELARKEAEHEKWSAEYGKALAQPGSEGDALRRAAEATADQWGVRIAPDGSVVVREPEQDKEAGS